MKCLSAGEILTMIRQKRKPFSYDVITWIDVCVWEFLFLTCQLFTRTHIGCIIEDIRLSVTSIFTYFVDRLFFNESVNKLLSLIIHRLLFFLRRGFFFLFVKENDSISWYPLWRKIIFLVANVERETSIENDIMSKRVGKAFWQ